MQPHKWCKTQEKQRLCAKSKLKTHQKNVSLIQAHIPRCLLWSIVAKTFRETIKSNPDININLKLVWLPKFIQHGAQLAVSSPAQLSGCNHSLPMLWKMGAADRARKNPLCVEMHHHRHHLSCDPHRRVVLGAKLAFWVSFWVPCHMLLVSPSINGLQRCTQTAASPCHALLTQIPGNPCWISRVTIYLELPRASEQGNSPTIPGMGVRRTKARPKSYMLNK